MTLLDSSTNLFALQNEELFNPPSISLEEINDIYRTFPFSRFVPNGKKEIVPLFNILNKNRKEKEDNIRKKIKANFLKCLKETINYKLEKAGSNLKFESLPQIFISDISKKINYQVMQLTYEQLFDFTHQQVINENQENKKKYIKKRNRVSLKKYLKNVETLKILNSNKKLREDSCWEKIRNMKYVDLLKAYFNSNEFQQLVEKIAKKESHYYLNAYLYFSSTYVEFFNSYRSNIETINNKDYIQNSNSLIFNPITSSANNSNDFLFSLELGEKRANKNLNGSVNSTDDSI